MRDKTEGHFSEVKRRKNRDARRRYNRAARRAAKRSFVTNGLQRGQAS